MVWWSRPASCPAPTGCCSVGTPSPALCRRRTGQVKPVSSSTPRCTPTTDLSARTGLTKIRGCERRSSYPAPNLVTQQVDQSGCPGPNPAVNPARHQLRAALDTRLRTLLACEPGTRTGEDPLKSCIRCGSQYGECELHSRQ